MANRGYSTLTKLGLGALTFNSVLAIYNSWGDAASVTSVLAVDAALVLVFLCLREFERGGNGRDAKTKAAVWALTALLTAMFASGVAPTIMPLAVGALVLLCLRDADHDRAREEGGGGGGGGRVNMDGQYCVLTKVGFAVLTCSTALDAYDTRRESDSAALVFVSYTLLGILMASTYPYFLVRSGYISGYLKRVGYTIWTQYAGLTKLALSVLTFNSVLAIYNSWGDASSVSFVLAADAILVLLFLCLRALEQERARQGQGYQDQSRGVDADDAALGHVRVKGGAADATGHRRDCLGDGRRHGRRRLLGVLPQLNP
ncbi:unnamed protein product [Miscanthus lutarioriparius]|uniref:Uncharacterized protein n=1 Tax=Miscanthus lutarioriparius TaxID=422564 RepID=A0A811SG88_9POAL|nr:unnamed protein product [Miscanthus lutarioriparius]